MRAWPSRRSPRPRPRPASAGGATATRRCGGSSRGSWPAAARKTPARAEHRLGRADVKRSLSGRAVLHGLRVPAEQGADLGLAEPPVAAGSSDAADAARCRPPGNRLRVDSEESSDLSGSEKPLTVPVHASPLVTSVAEPVISVAERDPFSAPISGIRWPADRGRCARGRAGRPRGARRPYGGPVASLVSVGEIRAAAARIAGVAVRTPLVPFPGVDPLLLVKPESLQPTGAFKLRGAYAAISALPVGVRARGVVAHSSGN